ncbi:MAG TPA: hypothetical protein PLP83_00360 [Candidatus Aminicenantes bacterium]|nr:hypothetical protein [Candidatus Aminicenantes bacterium]
MKRALAVAAALAAVPALCAGRLAGHGLEVQARLHPPAVVLRAVYSGGDTAAFAAVQVLAPGTPPVVYQSGHADASGRFAFVPDREGEWQAIVDDELGHREKCRITVDRAFLEAGPAPSKGRAAGNAASGPAAARLPLWLRAAVGVALILGATGVLYGLRARRRPGG